MRQRWSGIVLSFWLMLSGVAQAATFSGQVTRVTDGDTVVVRRHGTAVKVRLEFADAPEVCQWFGQDAKRAVEAWTLGQSVRVDYQIKDRYGRVLGRVTLPNGRELNAVLVQLGYAWVDVRYHPPISYVALMHEARQAKVGLWAYEAPLEPWVFRKRHGPCAAKDYH